MKRAFGLAAAVGLHILLLGILLRDRVPPGPPGPAPQRSEPVWVKLRPLPANKTALPSPLRLPKPAARQEVIRPAPVENIAAAATEETASAPLNSAELVRMAGAIGKELTADQKVTIPADSFQRKLERGMTAARDAVKPGLFEAARIELFSAPNDPKRIYKVITATGEYCVFYPDKNGLQGNDGTASFGQPKMSSCPIRF